jgi:hypothetical protein
VTDETGATRTTSLSGGRRSRSRSPTTTKDWTSTSARHGLRARPSCSTLPYWMA